jgi:hypothetical protein
MRRDLEETATTFCRLVLSHLLMIIVEGCFAKSEEKILVNGSP